MRLSGSGERAGWGRQDAGLRGRSARGRARAEQRRDGAAHHGIAHAAGVAPDHDEPAAVAPVRRLARRLCGHSDNLARRRTDPHDGRDTGRGLRPARCLPAARRHRPVVLLGGAARPSRPSYRRGRQAARRARRRPARRGRIRGSRACAASAAPGPGRCKAPARAGDGAQSPGPAGRPGRVPHPPTGTPLLVLYSKCSASPGKTRG